MHQVVKTLCVLLLFTGCASENESGVPGAADDSHSKLRPIAGGLPSDDEAVFLIEVEGYGVCSGFLIAPDLLLTAGHCVSGQFGEVRCEQTPLLGALDASRFRVSNLADLQAASEGAVLKNIRQATVLLEGEDLCGNDIGVLQLLEPEIQATPLLLASPQDLKDAATYRAVGYGAGHESGTGERIRRTSETLAVECSTQSACTEITWGSAGAAGFTTQLSMGEWLGQASACPGDSGGPALLTAEVEEAPAQVAGVLSRGTDDCALSIYTQPNSASLRAFVQGAARTAGYDIPEWAREDEPEDTSRPAEQNDPQEGAAGQGGMSGGDRAPAPVDSTDTAQDVSGCACQANPSRTPSSTAWLTVLLLGAWLFRRTAGRRRETSGLGDH